MLDRGYGEYNYKVKQRTINGKEWESYFKTLKECYDFINKSTSEEKINANIIYEKDAIIDYEIKYKYDTRMISNYFMDIINLTDRVLRDYKSKYINLKLLYNYDDEILQKIKDEIKILSDNLDNKFKEIINMIHETENKVGDIIYNNVREQVIGE